MNESPTSAESLEQPRTVAVEKVRENAKLTPEQAEFVEKVNTDLKKEHAKLLGEFELLAMTPAISNEAKVENLVKDYQEATAKGDNDGASKISAELNLADKQHKTREYKLGFLKAQIDQVEIKMGLSEENKISLAKLESLRKTHPAVMNEDRGDWVQGSDGTTIHDSPIRFSENGTYELDGLSLDEFKSREEAEAFTKQLPEGLASVDNVTINGTTMDLAPKKIGKLMLGPDKFSQGPESFQKYAEQVKAFLKQERQVDEISSTREHENTYGAFAFDVEKSLQQLPASEVKMRLTRDQYGYASINRGSRGGGRSPVGDYLANAFPKQSK